MTQPPEWWSQLTPGIHNAPPRVPAPDPVAFTWQQLQQIVSGFVNEFLRQVAVALGAIEIFGFHPYEALVEIGENIAAAKANFDALLAGLAVGDISGVLGYFGNLGVTGLYNAAAGFNNLSTSLLKHLTPTGGNIGQFDAAYIAGTLNTAVQIGSTAISSIFNGTGQFIGVINSAATGALNTALTVGGVSLNTLFTNIDSSGQLVLSGATGALNTAVTIGGTALSTLATNWNAAVTNINNLIGGVTGAADIDDVYAAINSAVSDATNAIGGVNDIITGAVQSTATQVGELLAAANTAATSAVGQLEDAVEQVLDDAGTAATTFGQSLQSAFTSWLGSWTGTAPGTASAPAVSDAIAAQRDAIVGISTAVAQLQAAAQASGATGVFGGDDFERTDTDDLGTDWSLTYSGGDSSDGYLAIANGHQAKWVAGDAVTRSVNVRRTATDDYQTQTNYQKIVWTVGSAFDYPYFNPLTGDTDDKLYVRLRGRVKSDETEYVFAEIRAYTTTTYNATFSSYTPTYHYAVQFGYKNGGSDTFIGSEVEITAPTPGDQIVFLVGNPNAGVERYFSVTRNASTVTTWDDSSSTLSALGSSNLGWGFSVQAAPKISSGQGVPVALDSITIADNAPGPGDYASLPAAGNPGRIYVCSDVGLWLKDNGTDWDPISVNDCPTELLTPPPDTGWSWVNQGGASAATELGGERITAPSSTRNWRLRVRTLSPTSNYTATACIDAAGASGLTSSFAWWGGIALRNSSSGSLISFGPVNSSAGVNLNVVRWNGATSFNANSLALSASVLTGAAMPRWLRIVDNGTNRYFQYSINGIDWMTVFSESRTAFITPDQFAYGANNEGSGSDVVVRLRTLTGIS